jgi:hypothetical protein
LRKYNKTSYKFALKIQNSTVFNHSDVADSYLKASQNGLPFVIDYGVALGKTPSRILGSLFLENDVLDLHSRLIPLSTSYTMSSDSDSDNNGRPTSDDLDESGEKTRDSESYLNR